MSEKVKILVIRFSSIGDIILCTPVLRCLKEQIHGDSEIHFITFRKYAQLVEHNPHVDQIHAIDELSKTVFEALKAEQFDYIIDLHHNLRSLRLKSKLRVMSFSFNKLNPLKWLLVNLKINRLPEIHIVDRYLQTTKALGIENDGKGLDYFLPPDISMPKAADALTEKYSCLVIAATHNTKKPTEEQLERLVKQIKGSIALIGGLAEAEVGESLAKLAPERIINLAGKCSIHESALVIKNSRQVITPDTGMMHIAAAFRKKIFSIWGNTVPEFGMYPYFPKGSAGLSEIFEVKGLGCRPCSKIGYKKCPKGHFKCMEDQDWQGLIEKANS